MSHPLVLLPDALLLLQQRCQVFSANAGRQATIRFESEFGMPSPSRLRGP